ncbi:TetR/AcrR family transcriptional regulator C-terminal domain-containing protein [Lachnobacterium bovis]|uniref:Transcriptional regulator, TetR family n=2 Tax=Lachnobacterium bovis TaxID=140626 RepID=A0A1H9PAI5_9FIRM|nr:TetR/AcrR family transcriptional regulator C-terminal domain-containing protein [Lachnobacterium bovis]SER45274.1 transcriptional regulator, TetR family [Lachnobacterium bovis]
MVDLAVNIDRKKDNKQSCKMRLAMAMKECMKTTSVDNITVKQIVKECGLSRQTFYRHFIDKYDLINWYFDLLLEQSFKEMGDGETIREGLVKKFTYIREESLFFTMAFKVDQQNNLKEHDFIMIYEFYCRLIREKTNAIPDERIRKILEMYCSSSIYMTVKWVLKGMKESESELADLMIGAMPREIYDLYVKLEIL